MSEPHIQPSPGQPSGCVLGGGEGKGTGGSGWRVRRIRQPKEPWQAAGTSSDGALDVLQPKHQGYLPPTLLLSFFVDALFILPLLLPLLLLLFCNYACEGVDWITTELSGRSWFWSTERQAGRRVERTQRETERERKKKKKERKKGGRRRRKKGGKEEEEKKTTTKWPESSTPDHPNSTRLRKDMPADDVSRTLNSNSTCSRKLSETAPTTAYSTLPAEWENMRDMPLKPEPHTLT